MAQLGRWTGGAKSQGNLPETWTAAANLFDVEARNDGAAYALDAATATLTLPAADLANGYLIVGRFEYEDTSNGRFNPQLRVVQLSGGGAFAGPPGGGYNRDASEDRSYVCAWAFVDGPAASAQFQAQWKGDTDDSSGGTVRSSFDVVPLYYTDSAVYTSTTNALYGGTTPNQVTGFAGTDGSNITLAGDVASLNGLNKRYLVLGGQFYEGRSGRTQRWGGLRIDGVKEDAAKGCAYYRNTSNDEIGYNYFHLLETGGSPVTVDSFCYLGDGVGAGQGGADINGSTPAVTSVALVVLELNDSAEVFHTIDGTGDQALNVAGPVDQQIARATDVQLADGASWVRASDSAMRSAQAMDALVFANLSAAQEVVSTTSRWTAQARATLNGAEDDLLFHGNYCRNNQGSQDTFGWSANLLGFMGLAANDEVGFSIQELAGGEAGGDVRVQPGWSGFGGINLDSLQESPGGSETATPAESTQAQGSDAGNATGNSIASAVSSTSSQLSDLASAVGATNAVADDSEQAQLSDAADLSENANASPVETHSDQSSDSPSVSGSGSIAALATAQAQTSDSPSALANVPAAPVATSANQASGSAPAVASGVATPLDASQAQQSGVPTSFANSLATATESASGQASSTAVVTQSEQTQPTGSSQSQQSTGAAALLVEDASPASTANAQSSEAPSVSADLSISAVDTSQAQLSDTAALLVLLRFGSLQEQGCGSPDANARTRSEVLTDGVTANQIDQELRHQKYAGRLDSRLARRTQRRLKGY